jgi:hypothetical protein
MAAPAPTPPATPGNWLPLFDSVTGPTLTKLAATIEPKDKWHDVAEPLLSWSLSDCVGETAMTMLEKWGQRLGTAQRLLEVLEAIGRDDAAKILRLGMKEYRRPIAPQPQPAPQPPAQAHPHPIVSVPHSAAAASQVSASSMPHKLSVLLVSAGSLQGGAEADALHDLQVAIQLQVGAEGVKLIHFTPKLACRRNELLNEVLRVKADLVHFYSHSGSDGIQLLDDAGVKLVTVGSAVLKALFKLSGAKSVRVVLMTGCLNVEVATVLKEIVPYVVGTTKKINNYGMRQFSGQFYRALLGGRDIKDAFEEAKVQYIMSPPEGAAEEPDEEDFVLQTKQTDYQLFPTDSRTKAEVFHHDVPRETNKPADQPNWPASAAAATVPSNLNAGAATTKVSKGCRPLE